MRKRYIGDYDHAVLATRASGTGNSARSLVYADGILLSNLLGNGAAFTPRWGMVTPEEIERVDVLYGPFSAAYSGNSVGAVVDFVTRMPSAVRSARQAAGLHPEVLDLYGTDDRFSAATAARRSAARGRVRVVDRRQPLDSDGQPIELRGTTAAPGDDEPAGTPVTGAFLDRNPRKAALVAGRHDDPDAHRAGPRQAQARLRLDADAARVVHARLVAQRRRPRASTRTCATAPAMPSQRRRAQDVNIDGRATPSCRPTSRAARRDMAARDPGPVVKSHTRGTWDWEAGGERLRLRARHRARAVPHGPKRADAPGRITDQHGTGWNTLALKGIWRPGSGRRARRRVRHAARRVQAAHAGLQHARLAAWRRGGAFLGLQRHDLAAQRLRAGHLALRAGWKTVLGARLERWTRRRRPARERDPTLSFAPRSETDLSPKAALLVAGRRRLVAARPRSAARCASDRERAVPGLDLGQRHRQQRPEPDAREVVDDRAERAARPRPSRLAANDAVLRAHPRRAVFAGQRHRRRHGGDIQNVDRIRTIGVELAGQGGDRAASRVSI